MTPTPLTLSIFRNAIPIVGIGTECSCRPRCRAQPQTLPHKVWDRHLVHSAPGEPELLYIDLHLVHEVTSPQAFDGLRLSGRTVRRPDLTVATEDHNVPTADIDQPIADPISARQVEVLRENTKRVRHRQLPDGRCFRRLLAAPSASACMVVSRWR